MLNYPSFNKHLIAICTAIAVVACVSGSSSLLNADPGASTCLPTCPPTCLPICPTKPAVPSQVIIHERLFTFSDYYEIDSDIGHQGNLVKTKLALRSTYEYFNQNGQHASSAYLRVFSLGALYTWAGVLDVYDANGGRVGLIEGAVLTLLPSKFSLYDAQNELVGTAYMDHDSMGFTVFDPVYESRTLANFRRIFVKDVVDHWIITINDPEAIDIRLLYSFGAFVLDNQNDFRIDD